VPLRTELDGELGRALKEIDERIRRDSNNSADLALALIASRVAGAAAWLLYSESLGKSAGVWCEHGKVVRTLLADDGSTPTFDEAFIASLRDLSVSIEYVDDKLFELLYNREALVVSCGG
jgi:hypothetical protein